ncbi:MAG: Holliday junction branch migration protein RuvA [Rhodobacter sp.]|jgi:holliday junction DNA helicase RuvA|nr:Holliday junction branch migration protein RuvA [Rhodobacter sp.]
MIGKVTGRLDYKTDDHALIDVQGIGYIVYCARPTLAMMGAGGSMVSLYTDLVVREDLLQLYGFPTLAEREWHRLLVTVQGVGAKAALAIAGTLGVEGVARAIALGDATAIKAAPGVGPKLAQRVVIELKDKAPAIMAMGASGSVRARTDDSIVIEPSYAPPPPPPAPTTHSEAAGARADALSALVNLGYGQGEAAGAIAEISANAPEATTPELIRQCLRLLAPKG